MKKKNTIIGIIIVFILITGVLFHFHNLKNTMKNILGYATSFMNQKTSDFIKLSGSGNLVNSKNNLKDSKITGEDYINNDLYYPYYAMMTEMEKKLYKQIYANIMNYQTTFIPVVKIDKNNLENAISAVFNDHPEIYWTDLNYSYKYLQNGEVVQITMQFNDTTTNIENSKRKFENAANEIIEEASLFTSDYEKEKYVHDKIITLTRYNKDSHMNQSAYSALVNHSSVCAGYSKAFQYIMIQLKIPTYYVIGDAGEDHAWNIVKLSDGYYNVDVTWDDAKSISYHYFNRPDDVFSKTHKRMNSSNNLPTCNGYQYIGWNPIRDKVNSQEKKSIQKEYEKREIDNFNEEYNIENEIPIDNNLEVDLEEEAEWKEVFSDEEKEEILEIENPDEEIMDFVYH